MYKIPTEHFFFLKSLDSRLFYFPWNSLRASLYQPTNLPIYLSIYLSIHLPIYLSIYLPIYLSVYLSTLTLCSWLKVADLVGQINHHSLHLNTEWSVMHQYYLITGWSIMHRYSSEYRVYHNASALVMAQSPRLHLPLAPNVLVV